MKRLLKILFCCYVIIGLPAQAVTLSDLQVAVRALGFTNNPPSGSLRVGIVYAPENPRSVQEAQSLQNMLQGGLQVGNLRLTPVMVSVNDVRNARVDLLFLTHGVGAQARNVLAATTSNQILCVTTDISQVSRGSCILGVSTRGKIEILVNRAAAANSGISFDTAFRMMITEF